MLLNSSRSGTLLAHCDRRLERLSFHFSHIRLCACGGSTDYFYLVSFPLPKKPRPGEEGRRLSLFSCRSMRDGCFGGMGDGALCRDAVGSVLVKNGGLVCSFDGRIPSITADAREAKILAVVDALLMESSKNSVKGASIISCNQSSTSENLGRCFGWTLQQS